MTLNIRKTEKNDIKFLQKIVEQTQLFPSDMLPAMVESFLTSKKQNDLWLTAQTDKEILGFLYAGPETLAENVWNMLALAILPSQQGKGFGKSLVKAFEDHLITKGARIVIVDTSGRDDFEKTRNFYKKAKYIQEATIRDFWAEGDDKITFWKKL